MIALILPNRRQQRQTPEGRRHQAGKDKNGEILLRDATSHTDRIHKLREADEHSRFGIRAPDRGANLGEPRSIGRARNLVTP
jgi:hypothetical protein